MEPQVWVSKLDHAPTRENFEPVRNREHWKPDGGMWTSTLTEGTSSEWIEFLDGNEFLGDEKWAMTAWLLEPVPSRLLEIASADDLRALMRDYERRGSEFRSLSFEWLDFEAMSAEFDGLWFSNPHTERFSSMFFSSLDAESTLWFRWCFTGQPVLLRDFTKEEGNASIT